MLLRPGPDGAFGCFGRAFGRSVGRFVGGAFGRFRAVLLAGRLAERTTVLLSNGSAVGRDGRQRASCRAHCLG
jgi:hypothetical protein